MLTSNYYAWKDMAFRLYNIPTTTSSTTTLFTEIKGIDGIKISFKPYAYVNDSTSAILSADATYFYNSRLQNGLSIAFGDDSSVVTNETYNPATIDISDRSVSTTLSFNGEERYIFVCNGRNTSSSSKTITKVLFFKSIYTKDVSAGWITEVARAFIFSIDLDEPIEIPPTSSFSITTEMVIS